MKKMIVILLTLVLMLASFAGCKKASEPAIVGGWTIPESPVITEELQESLDKALEGLIGANYIPVACIGRQLVSGTNYKILCRVSPVVPNPTEKYCVVILYVDLEGNAKITTVLETGIDTNIAAGDVMGGWTAAESVEITPKLEKAFRKATKKLDTEYTPVALCSTQVVSGTNYCIVAASEDGYSLVTLYQNVKGNVEVLDIADILNE